MEILITPEKTAITNGISTTCKILSSDFKENNTNIKILDYGCGKLRNSRYLIDLGFNVSIIDTRKQLENQMDLIQELEIDNYYDINNIPTEEKFDVILSSFVLNVVPDKKERDKILHNIYMLLKEDGVAYVEVRDDKFLKNLKTIIKYNDGVLTGSGKSKTFQKPYTLNELKDYVTNQGFKIREIKKTSNSIIAIITK